MNLRCRNALILLLSVLVLGCEADKTALRGSDERQNAVQEQPDGERRLISFWSILFLRKYSR